MDDDLEGRAREREAPSVERGSVLLLPKSLSYQPYHLHEMEIRLR